jgi:hypothetical protein
MFRVVLQHTNDQVGILSDHIISFRISIDDFRDLFRHPVTGNERKSGSFLLRPETKVTRPGVIRDMDPSAANG